MSSIQYSVLPVVSSDRFCSTGTRSTSTGVSPRIAVQHDCTVDELRKIPNGNTNSWFVRAVSLSGFVILLGNIQPWRGAEYSFPHSLSPSELPSPMLINWVSCSTWGLTIALILFESFLKPWSTMPKVARTGDYSGECPYVSLPCFLRAVLCNDFACCVLYHIDMASSSFLFWLQCQKIMPPATDSWNATIRCCLFYARNLSFSTYTSMQFFKRYY